MSTIADFEIAFEKGEELGKGSYGTVFKVRSFCHYLNFEMVLLLLGSYTRFSCALIKWIK